MPECRALGWAGRAGAEPRGLRPLRRLDTSTGQGTRHRDDVPGKLIDGRGRVDGQEIGKGGGCDAWVNGMYRLPILCTGIPPRLHH